MSIRAGVWFVNSLLEGHIALPQVSRGMGAVLICCDGSPQVLETYTYGDEHWDGTLEGFSIADHSG